MASKSGIIQNGQFNSYECTACNKFIEEAADAKLHPLIKTLICTTCFNNYGSGDFRAIFPDGVDENGDDNYCRWCCDGGDLINCANEDSGSRCHYAFCTDCIARNVPDEPILKIKDFSSVFWTCYVCAQTELSLLQKEALSAINQLTKSQSQEKDSAMLWTPTQVKQPETNPPMAEIIDRRLTSRIKSYKTLQTLPTDKPGLLLKSHLVSPKPIPTITWRLYPISPVQKSRSRSKTKSPSSPVSRKTDIEPHLYMLEPENNNREEEEELGSNRNDWIFDEHIPAYQRSEKFEPLKVRIIKHPEKGRLATKEWVSPLELLTTAKDRNKLRIYLSHLPELSRNHLIQDYKYAMGAYGIFEST